MDSSGGPVQTICDAPNPRGGAWGRSGIIVFAPDVGAGLSRVAASGGAPAPFTVLTDRKKHTTHRWPYFLPDGKHVLYLAANHASPRSEDNGIYVASLDGGAPRRLMSSYGSAQYASGWLLSRRRRRELRYGSLAGDVLGLRQRDARLSTRSGRRRWPVDMVRFFGTSNGARRRKESGVFAGAIAGRPSGQRHDGRPQ